ncbi:MAG: MMPL family transporter [Solirubrobacterales bacterium]
MLKRLADTGVRRPRRICLIALLMLIVTGAIGGAAPGALKARNDFEDPGSEAAAARTQLERATGVEPNPGVLALVEAPPGDGVAGQVARTLERDPAVARVATYANTGDPRLLSRNGGSTLIAASLRADAQPQDAVDRIERAFKGNDHVLLGGSDVALRQVDKQSSEDLGFAEVLVFPLVALLAFLFFRGVAVLLPLAVAILAVFSAFTMLVAINEALPLSIFALNLVFGLGLGLAVDYSLFLVSRFREELGRGAEVPQAVRTTMSTAGRTVLLSALTVAAAAACLLVFPLRFLQSMGIGGAVVALLAAAVSLTVLPAMFMLLGPRIGRYVPGPEHQGRWYRISHAVMRRPGIAASLTAAALLAVAAPSLRAHWSGVDASILPTSKSARVLSDRVRVDFPHLNVSPMVLAITARRGAVAQVAAYSRALARTAGVSDVTPPNYAGSGVWRLEASASGRAIGRPAQQVLKRVRGLPEPFRVAVGGEGAEFADLQSAITANLATALLILVTATLLILWIMTGSVVLPVKALIMNALTIGVATGVLVWVFQDARLTGLLSYTGQGGIESTDFLVLAAITFALSTDYGVFLLTRIKEARDSGHEDREAVAVGLQRTGKIVTAASVLLAVAIGAFATSKLVFLKQLGVGAAVAVLVDAFVVRTVLVPSLMALLGRWNWWQPRLLRRLHGRFQPREPATNETDSGVAAVRA